MLKQMFKYKGYIILIIVLIILEPTINSILNFWLQALFNSAGIDAEKIYILRLLTIGFLLWMVKRIVSFSTQVIKAKYVCNARRDIKHDIFVRFLNLDISDIVGDATSGEYISVLTNEINILETRFYNQVVSLISNIFSVLILGTSFVMLNVKLASAILVFGIVSMFVPIAFSKELNDKNIRFTKKLSEFTQSIKEYTVSYPTIKNYSIEEAILKKFSAGNIELEDSKFESDYSLALANSIGSLLSWFMQFIAVGMGLMLVINGEIVVGTVVSAQSFAGDLGLPLQNIIININSIQSIKELAIKFEKTWKSEKEGNENPSDVSQKVDIFNDGKCYDIEFDDLCLKMNEKDIINHFSFRFESGKKYLIVGINGAGKSSVFRALKKWFHNCKGHIYINEQDILDISNAEISKMISYMNEKVSLFTGTVKENILLFKECNADIFNDVVNDAHINLNLEREISDEGRNISSGEQRKIEIARSLLESVKILIFDEVVSTLDIETAYEIEKLALDFKDKTVIFISHNFSGKLIDKYDEILVMENGRIMEHGTYDYLRKHCSYFDKICEIKFGDRM